MNDPIPSATAPSAVPATLPQAEAVRLGDQLEQMFLEEMLKHCGPGALEGAFSGGAGEEQFTSFLAREHAALLAGRLDLGFAAMLGGRGRP